MKKTNSNFELTIFIAVYALLIGMAIITHDSLIALASALCGITYTILAGKGKPICYPIGATGSVFYAYLSFVSNLWGNLILYICYYIPMQICGFFKWNKNLKKDKYEIVKTKLSYKEKVILLFITVVLSVITIIVLQSLQDKNPVIDGITTIFSILGMYLTVKRCIEQWIIWGIVNGLSFFMWLDIALKGEKVYSTVYMWGVYFVLAIYFYINWKKELTQNSCAN